MPSRLGSLLKGWSAGVGRTFAATAEKHRRQGEPARAVELCREGLKQFPDLLSARVTLGCALMDLEQYEEARVELEYVLRRAPDNLAAIRGLAELHDRAESTALLQLEHLDDWPPRAEDIERAAPGGLATRAAIEGDDVQGPQARDPQAASPAVAGEAAGLVPDAVAVTPDLTAELLEEAEVLDAMAEQAEGAAPVATLNLDSETLANFDELATALADPADESGTDAPPIAQEGTDAAETGAAAGEPIVLDADSAPVDLDELVELELEVQATAAGESSNEDRPASSDAGEKPSNPPGEAADTETALQALERLLNQVKARRQQIAADSAA